MSKTVLITGASSGIGKELAILYSMENYNLILLGKSKEKLENTKEIILKLATKSIKCNIISYDLRDIKNIDKIVEENDIDIIVNCAGIGKIGSFQDISIQDEIDMLNINYVSPMILTKLYTKKFLEKGKGKIINICSMTSLFIHPYLAGYGVSKISLFYYSLALNEEIQKKNKNVEIFAICPGAVKTNFFDKNIREKFLSYNSLFGNYEMEPEKVAKEILKSVKKKKYFTIIGIRNKLFLKILNILPFSIRLKIVARFIEKAVIN